MYGRIRLIRPGCEKRFQPFLRFYRLCVWFLWVFKFFFGFLSSRRSAWNHVLHSFHTALGKVEAPFFGAPQKRKREKRRERCAILRSWALWGVCGVCQQACPVDHLRLLYVLDLSRSVYRFFATTSLCPAPLTTSTAPISASLRRA